MYTASPPLLLLLLLAHQSTTSVPLVCAAVLALDCEMCATRDPVSNEQNSKALIRLSVVKGGPLADGESDVSPILRHRCSYNPLTMT